MKQLFSIARIEVTEHLRQPWMLFVLALNYVLWIGLFGGLFYLVDRTASQPETLLILENHLGKIGVKLDTLLGIASSTLCSLIFTNLPLYVAIMSGTSVLHDRDCGTLPFLMLAPITRRQLLLGKLAGAIAIPLLFHLFFVGLSSAVFRNIPSLEPFAYKFSTSGSWWIAYLVGAPSSALLVGSLGTVISARSRDIRTSMQYTSFFIGLLSLGIGYVLADGLSKGVFLQIMYAVFCILSAFIILLLSVRYISKDITT